MKQYLNNYSVNGNVVTLTGVNRPKEAILCITDPVAGKILYTAQTGGASAYSQGTNSIITLTTAPSSSNLQIFYEDGNRVSNGLPSGFAVNQIAVSTSVQQLPARVLTSGVVLTNSSSKPVYIGNSDVTTSNGFPVGINCSLTIAVDNLQSVYFVSPSQTTGTISYLAT